MERRITDSCHAGTDGHGRPGYRRPVRKPDSDCWLHPGIEVRDSPIEGRGLFARQPLPAGAVVSRLGGRLVSWSELRELIADPQQPYVDTISFSETEHLVLPPRRPNGYGNHSCDPNLWWIGPYELATRRPVSTGEELTNDYATSTADPDFTLRCGCGAALCRGTVTGADWRRPDLQERYGEHWIPMLLARISRLERKAGVRPGSYAYGDADDDFS